jgi:hypothetical protein
MIATGQSQTERTGGESTTNFASAARLLAEYRKTTGWKTGGTGKTLTRQFSAIHRIVF